MIQGSTIFLFIYSSPPCLVSLLQELFINITDRRAGNPAKRKTRELISSGCQEKHCANIINLLSVRQPGEKPAHWVLKTDIRQMFQTYQRLLNSPLFSANIIESLSFSISIATISQTRF